MPSTQLSALPFLRRLIGDGGSPGDAAQRATPTVGSFPGLVWDAWRAAREGPDRLKERQDARLAQLVAHARKHSRFYRQHYRSLPDDAVELQRLPPTNKAQMMANYDDWVTDPEVTRAAVQAFVADPSRIGQPFLDRYTVWHTSGSTGEPALLLQDENALSVMRAMAWTRAVPNWIGSRELAAFSVRGVKGALVFATGGHYMALTMAERGRRANSFARQMGEIVSVLSPVPELVERVNAIQPTLLVSYASGLVLLAQEQQAGRLNIDPVLIISTGESLGPGARRQVEDAFNQPVRQTYGASEIQVAAFDCRCARLHVNCDWVILEPVDRDHRPVPPGTPSQTVLVTSLSNRVQPIIRYDFGDSITLYPDPCACGSPLPPIRVEGRSDEILQFRSDSGRCIAVLPAALATAVAEVPGVRRFQLIGRNDERLVVRLATQEGQDRQAVWASVQKALAAVLRAHGLTDVAVERAQEPPGALSPGGKLRQVWSEP